MKTINKQIEVNLEGLGSCKVSPQDFIAAGGEASIYRVKDTIIKVYLDDDKMIQDGMPNKIRLLSKIKSPYIVAPSGVVAMANKPIGFYMPFVEGEPLPRMFTNAFWTRNSFNVDLAKKLVDRMRETMLTAHQYKAIMVDPNEANWIVDLTSKNGPEPRVFDVDSWAIDKWPAKVIVTSIRDFHNQNFNEKSDWFSWAVITFQLFTGIHPYRGTLPGYGIQLDDLISRMKKNVSVFSSGIRLNKAVRDFSTIPGPLLSWYQATFQKGERTEPPSAFAKSGPNANHVNIVQRAVVTMQSTLYYTKLFERVSEPVVKVFACGVVKTNTGDLYDLSTLNKLFHMESDGEIISVTDGWLIADKLDDRLVFTFVDKNRDSHPIDIEVTGNTLFKYENRLFYVNEKAIVEIGFINVKQPLIVNRRTIQIMNFNSTQWFEGVAIQQAFDAKFLILPFGEKSSMTVRTTELDSMKIIDAKAGMRYAIVIGIDKQGLYHKFEFTFNMNYSDYTVLSEVITDSNVNISILPKMVCAKIDSDGELIIFVPTNGKVNKISDRNISTDMQLTNCNDRVIYIQNGSVWSLKT